jgi:hypothetical protein
MLQYNTHLQPAFAIYNLAKPSPLKRKVPLKTYQVTNDEQRFKLINTVMGPQKLTIREVM